MAMTEHGVIDWGIVATVKAPQDQVLAFVAYHLDLGASQIWLCFDDPADPVIPVAAALPGVTAIACDDDWWARIGARPDRHQNRQARNAQTIYRDCPLPWLAHIDVDEFIQADLPLPEILATLHPDQVMLRIEPFEAMHDPDLPEGVFAAGQFRGALKAHHADLRAPVLGAYAPLLPEGMLSHRAGKYLFRTRQPGLQPRLHGAFIKGIRLPAPPFDPRLRLLHFHAQNQADWLAALPFRLTRGAYQYHPELQVYLAGASAAEIDAFYAETQIVTLPKAEALSRAGRLVTADLQLGALVHNLMEGAAP